MAGGSEQAGGSSSSTSYDLNFKVSTDEAVFRFNTALDLLGKGDFTAVTKMFETSGESKVFDAAAQK